MEFEKLNIPNLDALGFNELHRISLVFDRLSRYSFKKAEAMRYREAGTIPTALGCEAACEDIYKTIPNWARW